MRSRGVCNYKDIFGSMGGDAIADRHDSRWLWSCVWIDKVLDVDLGCLKEQAMTERSCELCNDKKVLYNGLVIRCEKNIGHPGPHLKSCGSNTFYSWPLTPQPEQTACEKAWEEHCKTIPWMTESVPSPEFLLAFTAGEAHNRGKVFKEVLKWLNEESWTKQAVKSLVQAVIDGLTEAQDG